MTDSDPDKERGLYGKYYVSRADGIERDGARYFVLDYGRDPIAQRALSIYSSIAREQGFGQLADDLDEQLRLVGAEHVL